MKPPKTDFKNREASSVEKIKTDEFVTGIIENIKYEEKHVWRAFEGNEPRPPGPAVKFVFVINGYKFPHYTEWMTFSYHEKSKLFTKFIQPLVANAKPYMDFDLDQLKGLKVKMLWKDKKNPLFQEIETIRPLEAKVIPVSGEESETVPF